MFLFTFRESEFNSRNSGKCYDIPFILSALQRMNFNVYKLSAIISLNGNYHIAGSYLEEMQSKCSRKMFVRKYRGCNGIFKWRAIKVV